MNRRLGKLELMRKSPLDEVGLIPELRRILPKKNNYGTINASGLIAEATDFGILSRGAFRRLMLKHCRRLKEIDRTPLDELHERIFGQDLGIAAVREFQRRHFWFSWEALVRTAFELEFGERYEAYAFKRDGITS